MTPTRESRGAFTPEWLVKAPGFKARKIYQAYLTLWNQHMENSITGPQYAVLAVVEHNPRADLASVAAAAAVDPSTMSDMVKRLERRELIVRFTSLEDKRVKLLEITSLGKKALTEARDRERKLAEHLFNDLPLDRRAELMLALEEIEDIWQRIARDNASSG